jgi:hypothetical protein
MKNAIKMSVVLSVLFILTNCTGNQRPATVEVSEPTPEQIIERGDYLVTIMSCHDCHSPKKMGTHPEIITELMLSGYPADQPVFKVSTDLTSKGMSIFNPDLTASAGPWGMSFAANLTSDQTGIGNWTEENFKRALKEGLYKGIQGSRTLLPPMPWFNYVNILDEDIEAIFAYLKSTPPVSNVVPLPIPPDKLGKK